MNSKSGFRLQIGLTLVESPAPNDDDWHLTEMMRDHAPLNGVLVSKDFYHLIKGHYMVQQGPYLQTDSQEVDSFRLTRAHLTTSSFSPIGIPKF